MATSLGQEAPMHAEFRSQLLHYLMSYARDFSTRDVLTTSIDILIVYYVIYRTLKLIRGTRAAQMLVGMVLVAGFFFAAKRLELTTVSWLFENLINYFIIFLIVIFQHDIRRGLMQVGQNLFRRRQYEETYVIEEVVQAADELSRHRIGGLIVIERDADLSDHLGEVGIVLDAKVTKELLVTLFIPDADNHMHDGAVIIKNLRIQQAGAVLPLSANAKLDKQLGTRHRAAIGITEESDAVVVVVSEERGTVALCFNGNIARDLSPPTLRKALLGLFQKKNKGKGRGKGASIAPGKAQGQGQGHDQGQAQADSRKDAAGEGDKTPVVTRDRLPPELLSLVVTQPMPRPRTDSTPGPGPGKEHAPLEEGLPPSSLSPVPTVTPPSSLSPVTPVSAAPPGSSAPAVLSPGAGPISDPGHGPGSGAGEAPERRAAEGG
jgi:uncharacterized protein (TIGR00159 family)